MPDTPMRPPSGSDLDTDRGRRGSPPGSVRSDRRSAASSRRNGSGGTRRPPALRSNRLERPRRATTSPPSHPDRPAARGTGTAGGSTRRGPTGVPQDRSQVVGIDRIVGVAADRTGRREPLEQVDAARERSRRKQRSALSHPVHEPVHSQFLNRSGNPARTYTGGENQHAESTREARRRTARRPLARCGRLRQR